MPHTSRAPDRNDDTDAKNVVGINEDKQSPLELKGLTSRTGNTGNTGNTRNKTQRYYATLNEHSMTPRTAEACKRCGISASEISAEAAELTPTALEALKAEGRSEKAIAYIKKHVKSRREALLDTVRDERNKLVRAEESSIALEEHFLSNEGGMTMQSPQKSGRESSKELGGVAGNLVALERRRMEKAKEKLEQEMSKHLENELANAEKERQQKIKDDKLEQSRRRQAAEIDRARKEEAARRRKEQERKRKEEEQRYEAKQQEIRRQLAVEREKEMAAEFQRQQELQQQRDQEKEKEEIMAQRQRDLEEKHRREEQEMLEKLRGMEQREEEREQALERHKAQLRRQAEEKAQQHAERMKRVRERDAEQIRLKREAFDKKQEENQKKAEEQERQRQIMFKEKEKARAAKEKQIQTALRQAERQEEDRINNIIKHNEEKERAAREIREANAEADELKCLQQELHKKEKLAAIRRKQKANNYKRMQFWEKNTKDDEKMRRMHQTKQQLLQQRQDIRRKVMIQKHTIKDEMDSLRVTNNFDTLKSMVRTKDTSENGQEGA